MAEAFNAGICKVENLITTITDSSSATQTQTQTNTDTDTDDEYGCSNNGFSLFRGMREDVDGKPLIGQTARTLGARENIDISVYNGNVSPNTGGMSVSPFSPFNLPIHRRPPILGGTGQDPVWCVDALSIQSYPSLQYRPDPHNSTGHGFIEPSVEMTFVAYQASLAATKLMWSKVNSQ